MPTPKLSSGRPADAGYAPRAAQPVVRRITLCRVAVASDGVEWIVYEASAVDVPGARGATCLVFDCVACVRRVWSYPADWATLADEELIAVSRRR